MALQCPTSLLLKESFRVQHAKELPVAAPHTVSCASEWALSCAQGYGGGLMVQTNANPLTIRALPCAL